MQLLQTYIDNIINTALTEDINYMDMATDYLIPAENKSSAAIIAKDDGKICGLDVFFRVFRLLDDEFTVEFAIKDGSDVKTGDRIAAFSGHTSALLKGERTALNLLQHMSGIATAVSRYQAECAGTKCHICETRKTLPGLRGLEKYAVLCGGGRNHRYNLSDAAMLKDNHIDACGSLTLAVETLRGKLGHMTKIEVEVRNKAELLEALDCKADVIMLDNMSADEMAECVKIVDGRALLEASGNVTIERVKAIAAAGVDVISVGALTHSVKAFDISMKIKKSVNE
jgi:nicotinate-nucleotide pyrophosphorylase (carboxylating)